MKRMLGTRWSLWLASSTLVVNLWLLLPLQLFSANQGEFSVGLLWAMMPTLPFLAALIIMVGLISWLCSSGQRYFATVLIFGLALATYIQSNLLVWSYSQFDGAPIDWSIQDGYGLIDLTVWCLIAIGLIVVLWRRLDIGRAMLLLLLLELITLPSILLGRSLNWSQFPETDLRPFQLSKSKNVIMILLDGFASPAFDEILKTDHSLAAELSGFTYFPDNLAAFPVTHMSVPAMLSGTIYDNTVDINDFMVSMFAKSLPAELSRQGWNSDLVTLGNFCLFYRAGYCSSLEQMVMSKRWERSSHDSARLFDLVIFRSIPHAAKRWLFTKRGLFLQRYAYRKLKGSNHYQSLAFSRDFVSKATAALDAPQFKLYHLLIPHHPIELDANCEVVARESAPKRVMYLNQARCALRLARNMLDRIKQLNLYESSLILIVADHGVSYGWREGERKETGRPFRTELALPLLLIKPPGATEPLHQIDLPSTVSDIPATLAPIIGLPAQFSGVDLYNSPAMDGPRKRTFHFYSGRSADRARLPPFNYYEVYGPARSLESWRTVRRAP